MNPRKMWSVVMAEFARLAWKFKPPGNPPKKP
jgi:hypothetical protein